MNPGERGVDVPTEEDVTGNDGSNVASGVDDSHTRAANPFYERVERKDAPMIGLRLSADLYAAVAAEARREGLPVVEVVRGILRAWVATQSQTERKS